MDRDLTYTILITLLCLLGDLGASHYSKEDGGIHIQSLHVGCKVTSRFARTVITSQLINKENASKEAFFDVELPKLAFITNLSMTVNGVTTLGKVKEKEAAKRKYMTAVSQGQSAGLVRSSGRKTEQFKVSVNIAASATATFVLTYEELLKRHFGKYELLIKVRPKQLVEHFQVDAHIFETEGINYLEASGTFMTNELTHAIEKNVSDTKANIVFKPTLKQQQKCPGCRDTLLDGDFIINYDVKRDSSAGNIQVVNGYFVHHFAPANLQTVPKNVVFVIDRSGSMYGRKIHQTREALLKILGDMSVEDQFGIIIFDDAVRKWKDTLVGADPANITEAKQYISNLNARGGTDINHAVLDAVDMLSGAKRAHMLPEMSTSIIILLTDGDPTSGVTNPKDIQRNVKAAIGGSSTLYCLGFGHDVDYHFLEKMALENGGLARRIYEDSGSALQLQDFYKEVANPLLLDVEMQYLKNSVSDLTENKFRHYYSGSELVVAGRITNDNLEILKSNITARAVSAQLSLRAEGNVGEMEKALQEQEYIFGDYIERLWAYLTIEQLLTQGVSAAQVEKNNLTEKALHLSLKYNFVTPLTSMVVTTSEDEEKRREVKDLVANKPGDEDFPDDFQTQPAHPRGMPPYHGSWDLYSRLDWARDPVDTHYYVYSDYEMAELEVDAPIRLEPEIPPHISITPETLQTAPESPQTDFVDAHFLLQIPTLAKPVCLVIDEDKDVILNLVTDAVSGIILNGQLINGSSDTQTYFGKFALMNKKRDFKVEVTTTNITIYQDEDIHAFPWSSTFVQTSFVHKEGNEMMVTMENGVKFSILLHQQPEFLKLYFRDSHLFSNKTFGLLGQIFTDCKVNSESNQSSTATALVVNGQILKATSALQKHYRGGPEGSETNGSCWLVRTNGSGVVDGIHTSYRLSSIFDTKFIH